MPIPHHEQLRVWFNYHRPTDEQQERYDKIRAAELETAQLMGGVVAQAPEQGTPDYGAVNKQFLKYADTLNEVAPDGEDKTTAIQCVRKARMATNEALIGIQRGNQPQTVNALLHIAGGALMESRWWACAAIACDPDNWENILLGLEEVANA